MDRLKDILDASPNTVTENWKDMKFVLLFVIHQKKKSGSLLSEQKVDSGVSSLMLQCVILSINEEKHARKNKMQVGPLIFLELNPVAPQIWCGFCVWSSEAMNPVIFTPHLFPNMFVCMSTCI